MGPSCTGEYPEAQGHQWRREVLDRSKFWGRGTRIQVTFASIVGAPGDRECQSRWKVLDPSTGRRNWVLQDIKGCTSECCEGTRDGGGDSGSPECWCWAGPQEDGGFETLGVTLVGIVGGERTCGRDRSGMLGGDTRAGHERVSY